MAEHHKTCAHCGVGFVALTARARFCSKKCASMHLYWADPEKARARQRDWSQKNAKREATAARVRKWKEAHPEKVRDEKRRWHNDRAASSAHMHALGIITVKGGKLGNDQPE